MKRLNASVGKFAPPDTAGGQERDHEERDEHEEKRVSCRFRGPLATRKGRAESTESERRQADEGLC
jgi:hypothetical protein